MKKLALLLGIAAVAGAMYATTASGSQQSSGPTLKQFNALKAQVATLNTTLKAVKALAGDADVFVHKCFLSTKGGVLGISQFGDPNGTFGYQYTSAAGQPVTSTSALDASSTPAGYLQAVDPSCVSAGTALPHRAPFAGSSRLVLRAERSR